MNVEGPVYIRRQISKKGFVAPAQLASRISAMMSFGAGAGDDPFVNSCSSEVEAPRIQLQFTRERDKVPFLKV